MFMYQMKMPFHFHLICICLHLHLLVNAFGEWWFMGLEKTELMPKSLFIACVAQYGLLFEKH